MRNKDVRPSGDVRLSPTVNGDSQTAEVYDVPVNRCDVSFPRKISQPITILQRAIVVATANDGRRLDGPQPFSAALRLAGQVWIFEIGAGEMQTI